MIDNMFLLAVGALGWGLSLATYRMFARRNDWPMGSLQADLPAVPAILGIFSFLAGILFAAARGPENGGLIIVLFGLLLTVFWIGFLRVGSQISLILAPAAAALLLIGWLSDFDKVGWLRSDTGGIGDKTGLAGSQGVPTYRVGGSWYDKSNLAPHIFVIFYVTSRDNAARAFRASRICKRLPCAS